MTQTLHPNAPELHKLLDDRDVTCETVTDLIERGPLVLKIYLRDGEPSYAGKV